MAHENIIFPFKAKYKSHDSYFIHYDVRDFASISNIGD